MRVKQRRNPLDKSARLETRRRFLVGGLLALLVMVVLIACAFNLRLKWTSRGLYPYSPLRRGEIGPFAYVHGADPNVGPGFHFLASDDWGTDGYWVMIQNTRDGVSIGVNIGL